MCRFAECHCVQAQRIIKTKCIPLHGREQEISAELHRSRKIRGTQQAKERDVQKQMGSQQANMDRLTRIGDIDGSYPTTEAVSM